MNELILVEDNPTLGNALRATLEVEGFSVHVAPDAASGIAFARHSRPTLVIVDVTLGGEQGYQLVRAFRDGDTRVAILAIAALQDQVGLLHAFRVGADDCIAKPVDAGELKARVRALLRRTQSDVANLAAEPLRLGSVTIWPSMRLASRAGRPLALRPREFDLLLALVMRRGCVVSRAELLRTVWGWYPDTETHTVDIHVSRLRRLIEPDPRAPRYIQTVRPVGFLIPDDAALHAGA
jgi:DNA-binding response OmpR family regulator